MSTKPARVRKSGDKEADAADEVAEEGASTEQESTPTGSRSTGTGEVAGTMTAQRQESAAAGDGAGTVGSATVQYDPGPDRSQLSSKYGIDVDCGGRAAKLQRLEAEFGSDRVGDWADEGMPVGSMGKPQDMRAFRKRQADRPGAVPADVERQNEASVQRNIGQTNTGSPAGEAEVPTAVRDVVSSPGRSLDESVQRSVEDKTGQEYGDVRVHTGPKAARAAEQIDARAFTVGNHVAFNEGEYQPGTEEGQKVLAHELTHVRQQTDGAVSMLPKPGALQVDPDPGLEREAEETAQRVVEGGEMAVSRSGAGMHVQRQPDSQSDSDSGSGSGSDSDSASEDGGASGVDEQFVRRLFRQFVLRETDQEFRGQLATAGSVEEAQAVIDKATESGALKELQDKYAEHTGTSPDAVDFDLVVENYAPGQYVEIDVMPTESMASSIPAEKVGLMNGVTTIVGIQGFQQGDSTAKRVLAPFVDVIRDDDNPVALPNLENAEIGEDSDGNPIVIFQRGQEEVTLDPQKAFQEAVDIFMQSPEGKALQATAKSLGEDAKDQVKDIWETTWGKFAIPGVVLSVIGGVYAAEVEIPDKAVQWAKEAMTIDMEGDEFTLSFEPEYEGDVFDYGSEEKIFDAEKFGGKLDASYQIDDDITASTTVDYLNQAGKEEFLGNLLLQGKSFEFEGQTELDEGDWTSNLSGSYDGENLTAEFDSELRQLREGIEGAENEFEKRTEGEASGQVGYESGETSILGKFDIEDTQDKRHVLGQLEAELGGEMWSVSGEGEYELSEKGRTYLGKIKAEAGGDNWDVNADGYIEESEFASSAKGYGGALAASAEGEKWLADMEAELEKQPDGMEEFQGSASGGYEGEDSKLLAELDIADTADKNHVLSKIEAEMGGEMWSVGADGELELSEKGHRVLGEVQSQAGGENWSVDAEGYVEQKKSGESEWSGNLNADVGGDKWFGTFESELEGGSGAETQHESTLRGGYRGEDSKLVGELGVTENDDKSAVLSKMEAKMGGAMWSVGGSGELELSEDGHRVLGKLNSEVGGDNWDLTAEGFLEARSMGPTEAGGSLDLSLDTGRTTLDAGSEYSMKGGDHKLKSNLGMSYEAANRLKFKLNSMMQHAPDGTQLESDLQASYQAFDGLSTSLGATYERNFNDPQGQFGATHDLRYQFDQGHVNLQQTFKENDYQVEVGVGIRF